MSGTMTWVGFDVHARSTHGAAINSLIGELERVRVGPGLGGAPQGVSGHRHAHRPVAAPRARRRLAQVRARDGAELVAGPDPFAQPVRRVHDAGIDHQDRLDTGPSPARRVGLALRAPTEARRHPGQPPARTPTTSWPSATVPSSACTRSTARCAPAASPTTSPSSHARASCPASFGPPRPPTEPPTSRPVRRPGRRAISGRHARLSYEQHPPPCGRHARS